MAELREPKEKALVLRIDHFFQSKRGQHHFYLRNRHAGHETLDHIVGSDTLRFGLVGEKNAVAQNFGGQFFDVGGGDKGALFQEGPGACGKGEIDGRPRRRSGLNE